MGIDYLDALANLKFEIDCSLIVLTQKGDVENPIIYKGPGTIFQKDDNAFSVKFFCEGKLDIKEVFGKINRLTPGKLIDRTNYYSLKSFDYAGNTWTANSIMPDINGGIDYDSFLVTGNFTRLYCHREESHEYKGTTLKLFYKGKYKIPCNTFTQSKHVIGSEDRGSSTSYNVAQFNIDNIEFEILSEDDRLIVYIFSQSEELTKITAQRIHEALQFVLVNISPWDILLIQKSNVQETIFRTVPKPLQKSRVQPPLHFDTVDRDGSVWKLFELYLRYSFSYQNEDWHPLFVLIHKVIESGKASIEAYALTLAVSIEGLLKLCFHEIGLPNDEFMKKIKEANDDIKQSGIDENLKSRLQGALGAMKMPRAKDRLYYLRQSGIVEERLVKSWDNMRDSSAHSDSIDLSEIQNYLNDCSAMCVLFYQLIFYTIGYLGEYTDYSVYGYPKKKYEPGTLTNH
ncbi:hypothetical protein KA005_82885 [bacterium]|nr:hypothetical protein [bacterium]